MRKWLGIPLQGIKCSMTLPVIQFLGSLGQEELEFETSLDDLAHIYLNKIKCNKIKKGWRSSLVVECPGIHPQCGKQRKNQDSSDLPYPTGDLGKLLM